ncbi:hypothetical protein A3H55_03685 [Candidatus Kuenenbacteria bacterium RIFCSPLOWO2_02_FULL_42_16]|uniref:Uncharacterized protein n=1 Tax=Candidatus Kuenenbacteria bacterium RIFCSPLOWO2_02_FULL_42_16 TaxID=1798564 RepID=A0A1F6FV18_9BACT|nr:MAG: hypothetical protein A3H55_03685 [Candidatus Kuenenbacteria bacterium RIFCSPLOWO2_02_FULL_42_16]
MKWQEKVRIVLYVWWLDIKSIPGKIKRRIWNKHILLRWHKLYIRKDEFHHSLNIDGAAMLEMNEQERERYLADIVRRREIAHQRDLTKC